MALFKLRPASLRANRIVASETEPSLALSLPEMFQRFAPSGTREAKSNIIKLRPMSFFGLMKDETGALRNFTIFIPSRDNKIDWLLRRDPTFSERLVEVYEVETVQLDAKIISDATPETATEP